MLMLNKFNFQKIAKDRALHGMTLWLLPFMLTQIVYIVFSNAPVFESFHQDFFFVCSFHDSLVEKIYIHQNYVFTITIHYRWNDMHLSSMTNSVHSLLTLNLKQLRIMKRKLPSKEEKPLNIKILKKIFFGFWRKQTANYTQWLWLRINVLTHGTSPPVLSHSKQMPKGVDAEKGVGSMQVNILIYVSHECEE